ncbi:beta-galactosidase [Lactobacillus colini]|uniref:Beta-galactosidase n=1 Tax=Lactobacillus colini TaxID=1819254 RepID=A0ABS4MF66_9LACO|nr:glycoside hydrolase family 2 TIM barrel-domain containing protein [Lactobacillus colini]MBP2058258.1 beta-galactosidase [Lactobacillus colini]
MRKNINLNDNWSFHLGELSKPNTLSRKSFALGSLTSTLSSEAGENVPIGMGGHHFLKLIAQGDENVGLRNLAGTQILDELGDGWEKVDLPDDWKRRTPYKNNPSLVMNGSKEDNVAYYRRTFTLTKDGDKEYILHFDGIMHSADIWMNGAYLGHNESGYTEIDLDVTGLIKFDDEGLNVVLVRVDTTTGAEGWWYEGAGIYKNVWLEEVSPVHIERDSFYFQTLAISNPAEVKINFSVKNNSAEKVKVAPTLRINQDKEVKFHEVLVQPQGKQHFSKIITIDNPKLWSPEEPNLYQAELSIDGDELSQRFGIRLVSYDMGGFILNNKPYQLHGVCEHQDFAGVGVALNQDIVNYKIKTLKEMGINALRSSHHFASKELLNACDQLGIILMDENRLLEATPWRLSDLEKMVKKSRSHASLAFWSVANEEISGNTEFAKRSAKKVTSLIRSLHPGTILVSAELLNPEGEVNDDYLKYYDVLGVNYPEAGVMGNGAEIIHKNHPDLPMMSTENASYFSTRGIYKDNGDLAQCNNLGSMYSMVLPGKRKPGDPGVGGTAHPETVMDYLNSHSYMGGVFLWTGFDYYGEPSPFGWPAISSQFGISDLGGLPKDYYYYYQAHWIDKPVIHLATSWNKDDLEILNGKVNVRIFSNMDEVELLINGQSLGKQKVVDCESNWNVRYQSGELEARGFKSGELVATDKRITSNKTNSVQITARYVGITTTIFELSALDKNGNLVPDAVDRIRITSTNGHIIGVGNGNPVDHDISTGEVSLFSGKAVVIVKHEADNSATLQASIEK